MPKNRGKPLLLSSVADGQDLQLNKPPVDGTTGSMNHRWANGRF
ncbi:hypothetical protein SJI19_08275 [Acerihabitans sp. TG2]|nr:hypothetical protein [Acerihabitans sp. TG2]MEA9390536.1 hypothetical protein [Acerihabitans sp. TG2]